MHKIYNEILSYFPDSLNEIKNLENNLIWNQATEIRVRIGQPISIKLMNDEIFLGNKILNEDMLRLIENFCDNSIYSVQDEINKGFITLKGGHRIGLSGTSISVDGNIKNIKYISSLNIRIAREIKECSKDILKRVIKNNIFENTLIVSPPGFRKNNNS